MNNKGEKKIVPQRKLFWLKVLISAGILGVNIINPTARAQDFLNDTYVEFKRTVAYEYAAHAGAFLPFGIVGVRSDYSFWGLRFSHPIRYNMLEWGLIHGRGQGVIYYDAYVSIRLDFTVVDSFQGFIYFGPDLNYYKRKPNSVQDFPFVSVTGFHGGAGVQGPIMGPVWGRVDFKITGNPGTALYVGLGLVIKSFADGSQK